MQNDPQDWSAPIIGADIDLVQALLANARENGHPMDDKPVHEIAVDMNRCASDVEGWSHEYLVAVIRQALNQKTKARDMR